MPYNNNNELPDSVKNNLPDGAQTIYREAYNSAESQYQDPDKRRGEESAEEASHKVAWNAVKSRYHKEGDDWVED